MKNFLSCFFSIWFIPAILSAVLHAGPTGINCRHFNLNDGLLTAQVEYVFVDSEGYVWIATSNGLQQFDGYNFTNYTYDGTSVSYNFISSVSEDKKGNIWIGTLGRGVDVLNKENNTFHYLSNKHPGNTILTTNIVPRGQEVFAEDDEGFMWLNTDNGLNRINTSDFSAEHYYGNFSGELKYDKQKKVLWIASDVLMKLNPKTRGINYYQISTGNNRKNVHVNSFQIGDNGLIWLGTNTGLIIFDKAHSRFYSFGEYFKNPGPDYGNEPSWSGKPIESLYIDQTGSVWLAIEKSIVRVDIKNGSSRVFSHDINNPKSLLDSKVNGIYGNDSRTLWVVYASGGVSMVNIITQPFQYYTAVSGSKKSLSGNSVRSVFQDSRNNLWIGNYSDGLNMIPADEGGEVIHYRCDPANHSTISSDYITATFVDSRERLWVGTFNKGFCFADNIYSPGQLSFTRYQYEQNLEVQDFCEDAAGNIWAGTQWGLFIYDYESDELIHYGEKENQLPELQQFIIQSIFYEAPNVFWITTWNRGLCKLTVRSDSRLSPNLSADNLVIYEDLIDVNQSSIDNSFITLYKDNDVIWLGSYVDGLVKMTLDGTDVIKYDQSKGAPGNSVYGVAKDKTGKFLISTNHGLGRFDPETETFNNYYESDGLLSSAFIWNSSFQNRDGKVFFGGVNGLIAFYPHELSEERIEYNVHISTLIVKNKELQTGDKVNGRQILTKSLQYTDCITLVNEPAFTIGFVAVNPPNPGEIIYSYMLEGYDTDWIHTNSRNRYVTYNNLRQGTYTFLVKASNNVSNTDQNPSSITVRILPPWWRTSYALAGFSVLFFILLVLFRLLVLMRLNLLHKANFEYLERKKTEELFQFKMRFFADISHEFGNLLSLILTPLQNITSRISDDPQLVQQSISIRKNSERLIRLTEQVIDMRKIDLNKMIVSFRMGDIIAYVKELTSSFSETAIQRSISLEFVSDADSFVTWFDENKLDQIIFNLLSNAFKFTPDKGEIQATICIKNKPDDFASRGDTGTVKEIIEIRIKDNGIGIPAENYDQIFERFTRIERKDSVTRRGAGIGLAITKELVELQAGTISFISEVNKGTEFIINLPVIDDPGECGTMTEFLSENNKNHLTGQKIVLKGVHDFIHKCPQPGNDVLLGREKPVILLVEDEMELRDFLSENLKKSYQIFESEDGLKGLETALKIVPDLIISDILMPFIDGIELCKRIKSDSRTSHVPVILLTARSDDESRKGGIETGADAFVGKPFTMEFLDIQINNILRNRKLLKDKFNREFIVKPSDIIITSMDTVFLEKAVKVVEKHMQDGEFSSEMFAHEMWMSRSKLHRKLKALTSQSASEFIQSIRLKRAVDLIKTSQLSIEEISVCVGFNSPAYFTKCYKKYFGKTPTSLKVEKLA